MTRSATPHPSVYWLCMCSNGYRWERVALVLMLLMTIRCSAGDQMMVWPDLVVIIHQNVKWKRKKSTALIYCWFLLPWICGPEFCVCCSGCSSCIASWQQDMCKWCKFSFVFMLRFFFSFAFSAQKMIPIFWFEHFGWSLVAQLFSGLGFWEGDLRVAGRKKIWYSARMLHQVVAVVFPLQQLIGHLVYQNVSGPLGFPSTPPPSSPCSQPPFYGVELQYMLVLRLLLLLFTGCCKWWNRTIFFDESNWGLFCSNISSIPLLRYAGPFSMCAIVLCLGVVAIFRSYRR